jgi:hypothetical protein
MAVLVAMWYSAASADEIDSTDQTRSFDSATTNLRGVEQEERSRSSTTRSVLSTVFFVPRTAVDAVLLPMGYSIFLFSDTRWIANIGDMFYIHGRPIGWQPIVNLSTGEAAAFGATVYYRPGSFGSSVGGYYGDEKIFLFKGDLEYGFVSGNTVWQLGLSGKTMGREDFRFYGYGNDPQSDPRNSLKTNAAEEYGVYAQEMVKFQFVAGMRPSHRFEFFYTSMFQHRTLSIPDDDEIDNIDHIFDLTALPGFGSGMEAESEQFYNELAIRYDTREYQGALFPGVRIEGYAGLSVGVGNDSSKFSLTGIDAALHIPVIKRNRLLVPRVSFAYLNSINSDAEILFANYPRQLTFRGVGGQSLLRTDKYSVVPSIEYEWPLSPLLKGNLFLDYLLVGHSLDDLSFSDAPYAYGLGISAHSFHAERARLAISNGSEGFRMLLTFGLGTNANNRTNWE